MPPGYDDYYEDDPWDLPVLYHLSYDGWAWACNCPKYEELGRCRHLFFLRRQEEVPVRDGLL